RGAAGRGVGVGQVPELFERRHLVADGGGRDYQGVVVGDGLAADRLPGPDVLLDDRLEDRQLPRTEVSLLGLRHDHVVSRSSTHRPRVLAPPRSPRTARAWSGRGGLRGCRAGPPGGTAGPG